MVADLEDRTGGLVTAVGRGVWVRDGLEPRGN